MTLPFQQYMDNKPTFFVEKILVCKMYSALDQLEKEEIIKCLKQYRKKFPALEEPKLLWPKLHTIREDKNNRWKAGNLIHPVVKNRTPQRFQFMPTINCVSTQKIEIKYTRSGENSETRVLVDGKYFYFRSVNKNNELLSSSNIFEMQKLAINDGFRNIDDFFEYFKTDFTGKIIHWTDLKY